MRQLFDEVDQQARATFASVSLETLVATRPPFPVPAVLPTRAR
jgi:hypothetical protein